MSFKIINFASSGMIAKAKEIHEQLMKNHPEAKVPKDTEDGLIVYDDNISILLQMPVVKMTTDKLESIFYKEIEDMNIGLDFTVSIYQEKNPYSLIYSLNIKSR